LHRDLIAELAPTGPLEEDIVSTIARLLWRKQNLATFRIAELARNRRDAISNERISEADIKSPFPSLRLGAPGDEEAWAEAERARAEAQAEAYRAANAQALKELGDTYQLVRSE
jgi:hypothetical protein